MATLRLDSLQIPAARLGPENPLPTLHAYHTASHGPSDYAKPRIDYPDRGNEASILPYRLQDDYDRNKQPRRFTTAVLENDILRATFILGLGGRLWSLFHKPTGRELLHVNPVFQPANLAVRDAWFSGGVEWNLSIIGHCPFTCSRIFAARLHSADGTPILRLYEYERIRRVPFQIDVYLPEGSSFLYVRPRISNPNRHAVPMYWWSNIAVNEADGVRVLAPAASAFYHDYDRSLKSQDLPMRDGQDVSYSTRRAAAADLYFRIPPGQRPWITALDAEGRGLIHASTQRLCGRKMFLWGMDPGGRHWQEHLATAGDCYIEIQGGLATTQTEYVPMPAGETWEWLEAYGLIEADPKAVHAADWQSAVRHVDAALDGILPQSDLEKRLRDSAVDGDRPPVEILQTGSGWGALEERRRAKAGLAPLASPGLPFTDEMIGGEQQSRSNLPETNSVGSALRTVPSDSREVAHIEAENLFSGTGILPVSRLNKHGQDARATGDFLSTSADPAQIAQANLAPLAGPGLPFAEETLGAEQLPWLHLLEDGALPDGDPGQSPGAYMADPAWRELLESAVAAGRGVHWLSYLHLGVMRYRAGEMAGAAEAWERSLALTPSAVAYRNLAVLVADTRDVAVSADLLATAARMQPGLTAIAVEACEALLAAGRYAAMRELIESFPPAVRGHGRVRLLGATAGLREGDLAAAEAYFSQPCDIANIREGELTLSELWFEWHEGRLSRELNQTVDDTLRRRVRREFPLPREFDFRMKPD